MNPDHSRSITARILKRIRVHGRGWIFGPGEFVDLASRSTVRQALSRLTADGLIRRLAEGIYDYPRVHKRLGILAPNPDDVAAALAAKTSSRIQVSGARAANLLGLSDQVPAQLVYLTDGPPRRLKIAGQTIQLKHATASKFPAAGTQAGLALQAIRAVGPNTDKGLVVQKLSRALSSDDKLQLQKLLKHAPGWSHEIIKRLGRDEWTHGQRERQQIAKPSSAKPRPPRTFRQA